MMRRMPLGAIPFWRALAFVHGPAATGQEAESRPEPPRQRPPRHRPTSRDDGRAGEPVGLVQSDEHGAEAAACQLDA
jgi:hypothetical protein